MPQRVLTLDAPACVNIGWPSILV